METINQFQDRLGAQDGAIMRVDEVREPPRRRHPGPMIFMKFNLWGSLQYCILSRHCKISNY